MSSWGLTVQKGPWQQTQADRNMPVRGANRHNPYSPRNTYNAPSVKSAVNVIAKIPFTPISPTPNYYFSLLPSTYMDVAKQHHAPKMQEPSMMIQSFAPAPVNYGFEHVEKNIKQEIESMQQDDLKFQEYLAEVKKNTALSDPREPDMVRSPKIKTEKGIFDTLGDYFWGGSKEPAETKPEKKKPQLGYFKSEYVDIPPNPLYYNDQETQTLPSKLGIFRRPSVHVEAVMPKKPTLGFSTINVNADIPPRSDANTLLDTLEREHPEAYDQLFKSFEDLRTFRNERQVVLEQKKMVDAQLEALTGYVPPSAEEYVNQLQADFEQAKESLQRNAKVSSDLMTERENYADFVTQKYEMLVNENERIKMEKAKMAAEINHLSSLGAGFARRAADLEKEVEARTKEVQNIYAEMNAVVAMDTDTVSGIDVLVSQTSDVGELSQSSPSTIPFKSPRKLRKTKPRKLSENEYSPTSTPSDDSRKSVPGNPYRGSI